MRLGSTQITENGFFITTYFCPMIIIKQTKQTSKVYEMYIFTYVHVYIKISAQFHILCLLLSNHECFDLFFTLKWLFFKNAYYPMSQFYKKPTISKVLMIYVSAGTFFYIV